MLKEERMKVIKKNRHQEQTELTKKAMTNMKEEQSYIKLQQEKRHATSRGLSAYSNQQKFQSQTNLMPKY